MSAQTEHREMLKRIDETIAHEYYDAPCDEPLPIPLCIGYMRGCISKLQARIDELEGKNEKDVS